MATGKEQRKMAEETKKKAVEERKYADLEMAEAEEQRKIAEETKKKAVEERKHADLEMAEAEEQRKIAKEIMEEAVEVRKQADLEMAKAEEQRKIAEETIKKAVEDKKCAIVEMAKVEDQRKIAEATKKKAVEEKSHADSLTKKLEEATRRKEELEKKLNELSGLRNLGEGPFDQPDRNTSTVTEKTKRRTHLEASKEDADKARAFSEHLQFEVQKGMGSERKQAHSEMRKAGKKRKLVQVNTEKAMDGKHCCDHLSEQLEEAKLQINELQKQIDELLSSRKVVDALVVSSDHGISIEAAEVKLLKKQLKFEKKRVKHAKDVARLEKGRRNLLQQEVGCMKLELIQLLNRLDALDKCFLTPAGGIDDLEKVGDFARKQWSKLNKKLCSLKLGQTCLQTENQLLKTRCMDTTVSTPCGESFQDDANLLPVQRVNCTGSITGIDSKLESLLGGSSRKMLRSSAINSSTASFSDGQLVGSQERGALSVTTSAKLGEDNLNIQQSISSMSGDVTKNRCNENLAVVAENSVRSPLVLAPLGKVNGHVRKRKMILDAVESMELLCCETKKLQLQLGDKLSVVRYTVKGQMDKLREAELVRPNMQDIAYSVHDRSHKRRKTSNGDTLALEQSCAGLQIKQMQSCPEHMCNPDTIDPKVMVGFEDAVNKNYMTLLDLDDAAEEECYKMAAEIPISPTLPVIEFPGIETCEVDQFRPMEDGNCEGFSHENENIASSDCFDVMNVENGSNKLQCNRMGTLPKSLQNENSPASSDIFRCNDNGFCSTMSAERACLSHSQNPGVEVEMSVVPSSLNGVVNFPFESEIRSTVESIPKYFVVFSNIKDDSSVSKIFCSTRTCMAQCSLPAQTEFVVHRVLHALKQEEKLLPKEKVCVFFSLVLLNFYTVTSRKFSLIRDYVSCLNLFSEHINEVISDAEPRSLVAKLCLDELLSVIEDFLIEGRVMLYTNRSSETSVQCDSRFINDGSDKIFSHEAASADLLVAGSIILGSICAATDCAGFMCEAVYNIFRMHRYDTSVVLVILHVFAYVGGGAIFTLRNHSLTMTVLKSMVMFLESERALVAIPTVSSAGDGQPQFPACVGCPFSKDALSVDIVVSLLLAKLENYAQSGILHQDLTANLSNSSVTSSKAVQNLSSILDMNCEVSCCLDKQCVQGEQPESVVTRTLCDISDVLSLVELLACNMSWDWTCRKIISELWSMLESSVLDNLAVAIIILVGQLGRLGVDAVGYEDKEVENLRVRLSAFLWRETTIRAGLPIQLATVTALSGLTSLDFEKVGLENVKLPVMSGQFVPSDLIRNWFCLLTEEQRAVSIRLFRSVD
ncbi:hypothetical protein DITRI_Ditri20bG0143200 [Diplodiscus trichospermus]